MRLLIVDDGRYIVEYLKHLLDWSKFAIDEVQTTTSPLEAKQLLESIPIDILITDIRMPEVSGLDLLKWIRERQLPCQVIILSGYSDFEYAQSAVRFGAADYLLKPVIKDEMERAILQAVHVIKETRSTVDTEQPDVNGIGLLLEVLSESEQQAGSYSSFLSSRLSEAFIYAKSATPSEKNERFLLDTAWPLNCLVWFSSGRPSLMTAMLPASCKPELSIKCNTNDIIFSDSFLPHEKNSARSEFIRFYYGEQISMDDFINIRFFPSDWTLDKEDWEATKKSSQKQFHQYGSRILKILYLIEFIRHIYAAFPNLNSDIAANWIFNHLEDPDSVFVDILSTVSQLGRKSKLTNQDIVESVQAYLLDHLEDTLNLEELGVLVHLHPVYLCKFYKQETGMNLSSFLLVKRMDKAAHLLLESNLHIADISKMVGYKKPQYFIKLFKEQYGVTPYQYRRMIIQ
ncbi:response regulator transcription factor [Paenibacillus donghaensis]|uniref:response regulator transcription factor n=1 Tax=Paenibacillus donghaensis TaxID=414771 RepID=UPI0012FD4243|nr:response regulator [Paenibacillus donghaensis]